MLHMPLEDMKKKIQEQTELSLQEINTKISDKMKQLAGLISEEGACHIIANELSVQLIPAASERKVSDLLPGMRDIKQNLRVVQVYEMRTFQSKFSEGEGKVASFLGGDESGVIRATAWGAHADTAAKLKPGDIVLITNAYVKENNGRSELHLNDKSELTVNPEGVTVATSGKAPEAVSSEYVEKKISELARGDYRVELTGTVVQAYDPRVFDRKDGGQGVVANILIDDGTGNIRCALWDDNAAKGFNTTLQALIANRDGSFEEEKNNLLGRIVRMQGRVKLNETYNNMEMSVDSLEVDAKPKGVEAPIAAKAPSESSAPAKTRAPEQDAPAPKGASDAISLDELEDLDFDNL